MARGKKTGGGSRKGVRNKATGAVRDILDANVDFDVVVQKLFELGQGVQVRQKTKDGREVIYDRPPDAFALKTLLEYRFGKAPQPLVGDNENPVKHTMTVIFKDAE